MRNTSPRKSALLILMLIIAALPFCLMPKVAALDNVISIVPENNIFNTETTPVNSTFVVNATLANVTGLYNWQIRVTFNSSIIQCATVSIPSDSPFSFPVQPPPVINNVTGYIMLGAARITGTTSGSGVLATITFKITSEPSVPGQILSCNIAFDPESTYLLDFSMTEMPEVLVDGYYEYTWPPPPLPYLEVRPSTYYATDFGEDVAIEIWVHNVSQDWSIIGFQFILSFNASLLTPVSFNNGTFLESFVNGGESMLYIDSTGYQGDAALPSGYDAWVVAQLIMPDANGTWQAPYPDGEGLLATLHFNATAETAYPQIAWTDLNFTHLEGNPYNPYDNFECYAMDENMNEISFAQLYGGNYRAPYTCTLTIATTTGGTTNPTPGSHIYPADTDVSVTAVPSGYYIFHHWVLDAVNYTVNPINVHMDTNHDLNAVFILPNYTLTIVSPTGGTVNATTQSYVAGTQVTVTATPSTGYNFSHWLLDSANVSAASSYTMLMNANHTLEAKFLDVTPPTIASVTQNPPADSVLADQKVKVSVNATDFGSDVKNVTLIYTADNWTTSTSVDMDFNATSGLWEAEIPGNDLDILVQYKVVAYDNDGNYVVEDNAGEYYTYTVIPELTAFSMLMILLAATLLALAFTRKFKKPRIHS